MPDATAGPAAALEVDGDLVATYRPDAAQDRAAARDVEPVGPVGVVAAHLLVTWAGWYVTTENPQLEAALVAAGATLARHAHTYRWDLASRPPDPRWADPRLPDGVTLVPVERPVEELAALSVRAYPPGHPDHHATTVAGAAAELRRLLDGTEVGGFMPAPSRLAIRDGRVVAVALVNRIPGDPASGGPWGTELFREPGPDGAGLGGILLRRALAVLAAAGEASLGLAVTEGNPARSLYERTGFRHTGTSRRLLLPPGRHVEPSAPGE